MAEHKLPHLHIGIETAFEDITSLLKVIKPSWTEQKTIFKALKGGFSCSTYFCHEEDTEDGVTVRVRRLHVDETSSEFNNRHFEEKVVQIMSDLGIMAKVRAIFQNGYCYQYITGKPLYNPFEHSPNPIDCNSFPLDLIANKMAEIHSVKIDGEDFSKTDFYEKMLHRLDLYPEDSELEIPNKSDLSNVLQEIISIGKGLNPKIGLCHGDTHAGNMVYDKEKEKVTLVDWELTNVGYLAFDVAYFLKFFTLIEIARSADESHSVHEREENFVRSYLKNYSTINNDTSIISDEEFDEFFRHVQFFSLIWALHLIVLLGPVCNKLESANAEIPGDTKLLLINLYDYYIKSKDQILKKIGLKQ